MDRPANNFRSPAEPILVAYSKNISELEDVIIAGAQPFSDDYIVLYLARGEGVLTIGLHLYLLDEGDVIFLRNNKRISLNSSEHSEAFFCYLRIGAENENEQRILRYLRDYPHFAAENAVVYCGNEAGKAVEECFKKMLEEQYRQYELAVRAKLLQFEMLLFLVSRIGRGAPQRYFLTPSHTEYKYKTN